MEPRVTAGHEAFLLQNGDAQAMSSGNSMHPSVPALISSTIDPFKCGLLGSSSGALLNFQVGTKQVARLSDLKLRHRLFMEGYSYHRAEWGSGSALGKPLNEARAAIVTTAAFFVPGGDWSYRVLSPDVDLVSLSFMGSMTKLDNLIQRQRRKSLVSFRRIPSMAFC